MPRTRAIRAQPFAFMIALIMNHPRGWEIDSGHGFYGVFFASEGPFSVRWVWNGLCDCVSDGDYCSGKWESLFIRAVGFFFRGSLSCDMTD